MTSQPDRVPGIEMSFKIEGKDFNIAGEASSRIKSILQQLGIRSDICRRVAIVAYEAEMNVVIHANKGVMILKVFPDSVELTIEDEGPGISDLDAVMVEGFSTAPDYIREMGFGAGMGLPNIKRSSDEFRIESVVGKGVTLWVKINI
jgi:anti-sigma regulatory factor (Ser/Thr protein kinase)